MLRQWGTDHLKTVSYWVLCVLFVVVGRLVNLCCTLFSNTWSPSVLIKRSEVSLSSALKTVRNTILPFKSSVQFSRLLTTQFQNRTDFLSKNPAMCLRQEAGVFSSKSQGTTGTGRLPFLCLSLFFPAPMHIHPSTQDPWRSPLVFSCYIFAIYTPVPCNHCKICWFLLIPSEVFPNQEQISDDAWD